jgi:hypothetical protein
MGRPIDVIGDRPRDGYFYLSNDLIRVGAHKLRLDSDGFVVIAYLLSHAGGGGRPFETSPALMAREFGWSLNRERVTRALANAGKDGPPRDPQIIRDGQELEKRRAYVVAVGGRRRTDWELADYGRPIELPPQMHGKSRPRATATTATMAVTASTPISMRERYAYVLKQNIENSSTRLLR